MFLHEEGQTTTPRELGKNRTGIIYNKSESVGSWSGTSSISSIGPDIDCDRGEHNHILASLQQTGQSQPGLVLVRPERDGCLIHNQRCPAEKHSPSVRAPVTHSPHLFALVEKVNVKSPRSFTNKKVQPIPDSDWELLLPPFLPIPRPAQHTTPIASISLLPDIQDLHLFNCDVFAPFK